MNQDVINYIKEARQHGLPDLEIKQNLLNAGWEAQIVEDGFAHLRANQNKPQANVDEDIKPAVEAKHEEPKHIESPPALGPTALKSEIAWYKKPAAVVAPLAIVVLAGGGFLFYKFVYANPGRIWKKFTELNAHKIFSSDFKFSYSDKGGVAPEDLMGFSLKEIKLEFEGKAYTDTSDEKNPQSDSQLTYTFAGGNTSFSTGFEYRLLGKKIYFNVGNNPYLAMIFQAMGNNQPVDWAVLDLEEMEKRAKEEPGKDAAKYKEIFSPEFADELKKIWEDATFIKMEKYWGKETVNGKRVLRFSNKLDKEAIKTALMASLDKTVEAIKKTGEQVKDEDVNTAKLVINAIVDKLEIKTFETWIELRDFRLYKSKIVLNAPSVISAIKTLAMDNAQEKSRDAKRLADIRQMATAFELYFNDNGRYPDSKDGQPLEVSPKYIGIIPTAPTPSDGNCTDYYNTYWYELSKDNNQSYEITFCLGNVTGGYTAGINKLSTAGIIKVEGCPSSPDKCYKSGSPDAAVEPPKTQEEKIRDAISKISFDAEISIEANYRDYGVKKEIKAPEGAFDLMSLITDSKTKSRDVSRLADVRQMATSLELFYNDMNKYPDSLEELAPKYFGRIPESPKPSDGACTEEQNAYTYSKTGDNFYVLAFCLGSDSNQYKAGMHKLSPMGIE